MAQAVYYSFNITHHKAVEAEDKTKVFYCSICSASYKYEFCLKRHVLRNHINRAYVTTKDLTSFGVKADGHHARQELADMMFSCNTCLKLFADSTELTRHIKAHHQVFVEPAADAPKVLIVKCPVCKVEFYSMRSMNCHMRYHKTASWTSNRKTSKTSTDNSTAQNKSIPSASLSTSVTISKDSKKVKQPEDTSMNIAASSLAEPSGTCSDDTPGHSKEEVQLSTRKRQLRQRTSLQTSSLFSCTICKKTFHSYSNMIRHRRLSHESLIKKRPELSRAKKRTRKRTRFCDPKVARKYFNRVADNIAFNMKNCVHGNSEHVNVSRHYIRSECKTDLARLRPSALSKKIQQQCNIKTKPAKSLRRQGPKQSGSASSCNSHEDTNGQTQKQISLDSKSPDVYDRPGLWKFLCLVCLQYFPNTLELFVHQDNTHKRVNAAYMEVGKNYELPLHAVETSKPIGCLPVTAEHSIVCSPAKYTCTKCLQQFKARDELHPHLIVCGKDLDKPLNIAIPPTVYPDNAGDKAYGKVKSKKKGYWQRGSDTEHAQKKITDMDGFNVRKKKRSRLESEVEEQRKVEEKMRLIDKLSPLSYQPSLEPLVTLIDLSDGPAYLKQDANSKSLPLKYACPYCSIPFKYKKVYQRHIDYKCEMLKRNTSPGQIDQDENSDIDIDDDSERNEITALESASTQVVKQESKYSTVDEISPDKSTKANSVNTEEFFTPQKSLAQARVLAKFIHPARTCGPCFTCKKPNMARRYSHLQQRSETFVLFVMSKCKNISVQSCICKACELRFRNDYQKQKLQLEKFAANRKSLVKGRSSTVRSLTDSTLHHANTLSTSTAKKKPSSAGKEKAASQSRNSKALSRNSAASRSLRKAKLSKSGEKRLATTKRRNMSSLKRKQYTPVQTKSLEQIFPDDSVDYSQSVTQLSSPVAVNTNSGTHQAPVANSDINRGKDLFIPAKSEFIDVELEMTRSSDALLEEGEIADGNHLYSPYSINGDVSSKALQISPKRLMESIDLDNDSGTINVINEQEESDARLKVILQFVKDSPLQQRSTVGRKSSLTDIIDAVTQKVKEDPSLAKTLTAAINSAAAGVGVVEKRQTRLTARKAGGVRGSISLPSVLDGLVTQMKTKKPSSLTTSEGSKVRPVTSAQDAITLPSTYSTVAPRQSTLITDKIKRQETAPSAKSNQQSELPSVSKTIPISTPKSGSDVLTEPSTNSQMNGNHNQKLEGSLEVTVGSCSSAVLTVPAFRKWSIVGGQMTVAANQNLPVDATTEMIAPFRMVQATKRKSSNSVSTDSRSSLSQPRKKFTMTDASYQHMVEIIDAVARGEASSSPCNSVEDDRHSLSSCDSQRSSRHNYDFMVGSRDSLDYVRTADHTVSTSVCSQPTKNLRLANIISKLSGTGPKDDCRVNNSATSPTNSHPNSNSIDSGFVSLAE